MSSGTDPKTCKMRNYIVW